MTRNSESKKSYWSYLESHCLKTTTANTLENSPLSKESFQSRALEADSRVWHMVTG